ncbi:MAG: DNA gyrase subunit A [Cypionkella sp.]
MDRSFLEYASYVIRDRAIPSLVGRIEAGAAAHSLGDAPDGRRQAAQGGEHRRADACRIIPHGDASIGDAIVVLANKRYVIEGQGNFGNIFTGDPPAAPRYIEARLTELARTELFNDELTEFVPTYDGRNQEPVALPCKLPLLLMLGTEGIAVGLSARILPHNFIELLEAQVAILEGKTVQAGARFPDRRPDGRQGVRRRPRVGARAGAGQGEGRGHGGHLGDPARAPPRTR